MSNDNALIGSKMSAEDFGKARMVTEGGRIWQPKEGGDYMGKILMTTDGHLVQKIATKVGIVHDRATLDPKSQEMISNAIKDGKIANVSFKIGYENGIGKAESFTYKQELNEKTAQSLLKALDKADLKPAQKDTVAKFVNEWKTSMNQASVEQKPQQQEQKQAQSQDAPKR